MNYTVTSENFEAKAKGQTITEKELLELGLNIPALVAGDHLKNNTPTQTATVEETK